MFGCRMPKPLARKISSGIARMLRIGGACGNGRATPRFQANSPMKASRPEQQDEPEGGASQPERGLTA